MCGAVWNNILCTNCNSLRIEGPPHGVAWNVDAGSQPINHASEGMSSASSTPPLHHDEMTKLFAPPSLAHDLIAQITRRPVHSEETPKHKPGVKGNVDMCGPEASPGPQRYRRGELWQGGLKWRARRAAGPVHP